MQTIKRAAVSLSPRQPALRQRLVRDWLAEAHSTEWGRLPVLSLVSACGLVCIAAADTGARIDAGWVDLLFWIGILVVFVPIALRLFAVDAGRQERVGLVVLLGIACYLVKVLHSPVFFTFYDEYSHWRTLQDILRTGHLFQPNPLLPVSAFYPGLESATAALMRIGGLSFFAAGTIVVGAARLMLMLALFLFFELLSRSARFAGIATLIYTANPNFMFFDAIFAYESLSLPLALLLLYSVARRQRSEAGDHLGLTIVIVITLLALVVTHHVTSYAVMVFLFLWLIAPRLWAPLHELLTWYAGQITSRQLLRSINGSMRPLMQLVSGEHPAEERQGVGGLVLVGSVAVCMWLVYVASLTVGYLAPHFIASVIQLIHLMGGEGTPRTLFKAGSGEVAPLWERLTGFGSVGLILLALPAGLLRLWRDRRTDTLALVLGMGALVYPVTLAVRITDGGAELANRANEFLFLALGFALTLGILDFGLQRWSQRTRTLLFAGWATVLFAGGVIVGFGAWARTPGPYLVVADTRSVEPEGVAAAQWAQTYLGPNNRLFTDRINRMLMGTYGRQRPVTGYVDTTPSWVVFYSASLGQRERDLLRESKVHYVVVDRRIAGHLPVVGAYFERGERTFAERVLPLPASRLEKFDTTAGVTRIFDSGDIQIYDVRALAHETP
jgi:hypothetical protein